MTLIQPPHNAEAEQAVLGAVLLDNTALDRLAGLVDASDFYLDANRSIFRAMQSMSTNSQVIDVFTLSDYLQSKQILRECGGSQYLMGIVQNTASAANVKAYARIVKDRALERRLMAASIRVGEIALSTGTIAEKLDAAQSEIMGITETRASNDPKPIGEGLVDFVNAIESRREKGWGITGISTGLRDLDNKIDGLHNGELIILAGAPAMGKSSLAMQIAEQAAFDGKTALVFSLEMSRNQLTTRSISGVSGVSAKRIQSGELESIHWDKVYSAFAKLKDAKLIIDETPSLSVLQAKSKARTVKRRYGLDLVVVDYLQLMGGEPGENRTQFVASLSGGLKSLAREMDIPVIALSQLSRKVTERSDKRPLLSDLRDSGAIEQDADVVMFVYRDEYYNPETEWAGLAEIIIGKNRMGETGSVITHWFGEWTRFADHTGPLPLSTKPKRMTRGFDD